MRPGKEKSPSSIIRELLQIEESSPRDDGCGNVFWLLPNGKRHRKHGPAVIWSTGRTDWYLYGLLHRLDGPAIENISGHGAKFYYYKGRKLTKGEWMNLPQRKNRIAVSKMVDLE